MQTGPLKPNGQISTNSTVALLVSRLALPRQQQVLLVTMATFSSERLDQGAESDIDRFATARREGIPRTSL